MTLHPATCTELAARLRRLSQSAPRRDDADMLRFAAVLIEGWRDEAQEVSE